MAGSHTRHRWEMEKDLAGAAAEVQRFRGAKSLCEDAADRRLEGTRGTGRRKGGAKMGGARKVCAHSTCRQNQVPAVLSFPTVLWIVP